MCTDKPSLCPQVTLAVSCPCGRSSAEAVPAEPCPEPVRETTAADERDNATAASALALPPDPCLSELIRLEDMYMTVWRFLVVLVKGMPVR